MPSESDEYVNMDDLKKRVRHFVRERDWEKYHTPKDLAVAISVEAGELLEIFQWMKESEMDKVKENKMMMERIESELADILNFCLNMANILDLDLTKIFLEKLKRNEKKYPKEKYKGAWSKPNE
jgi:dCTP diphosphatase